MIPYLFAFDDMLFDLQKNDNIITSQFHYASSHNQIFIKDINFIINLSI